MSLEITTESVKVVYRDKVPHFIIKGTEWMKVDRATSEEMVEVLNQKAA